MKNFIQARPYYAYKNPYKMVNNAGQEINHILAYYLNLQRGNYKKYKSM